MTDRTHEPVPRLPQQVSDRHLDWSYERLAELRRVTVAVRDSDIVWPHERAHLEKIVDRLDGIVNLKRQREEYQKPEKKTVQGRG